MGKDPRFTSVPALPFAGSGGTELKRRRYELKRAGCELKRRGTELNPREDIAVATLLERTGHWVRDAAEPPYLLAQTAQDQLLALAIRSAAESGEIVRTGSEPWQR